MRKVSKRQSAAWLHSSKYEINVRNILLVNFQKYRSINAKLQTRRMSSAAAPFVPMGRSKNARILAPRTKYILIISPWKSLDKCYKKVVVRALKTADVVSLKNRGKGRVEWRVHDMENGVFVAESYLSSYWINVATGSTLKSLNVKEGVSYSTMKVLGEGTLGDVIDDEQQAS